ncbi:YgeY family selenium metabolism-linked hydrolase [bacterium]|nr:YgeY family selenium metabolism-linked hydrolase [bacterium]MBU1985038.1 YgeY family selenium metabolism-linked hydrolase [bacterium]
MNDLCQQIRRRAVDRLNDTVRFLCDLVRIPSFSRKEREVVAVIRREMEAAQFDEIRVDGLGNIIGRIGNGPRVVAFDAHIDTVYAGERSLWSFDPFTPKVEDGKVWGRGTVDQKGGMAAMISAGRIIKEFDLSGDLTILFVGSVMEEECDGLCWQYLIREERIRPELVVITEPTDLKIHRGQRGRMEMRVKVGGLSCHGSAPERGDNAIYKISRIALEIEKLNERLAFDEFLGKGTVAVTEASSSSPSLCAVPDGASLWIDRRLTTGETKEIAVVEIQDAAARAGYTDAIVEVPKYEEAAYTGLCYPTEKYYPTWTTAPDAPELAIAVRAYHRLFEREPVVDKWTFSTNGVVISGIHGIPCVGLGPGNEVYAHAPNEACPVEQLRDASAFYAALVAELNGRL